MSPCDVYTNDEVFYYKLVKYHDGVKVNDEYTDNKLKS